ncbi:MAG: hypothetical protein QM484_13625 [Woeseiaceae bacterium]
MLNMDQKNQISKSINSNEHIVYILSLEEMDHVIQKGISGNNAKNQWNKLKEKVEFSASYYATGGDIALLGRLTSDLGYAGTQAYIKYYGEKSHIILKGHPGLRKILNGTKYGVQNAKVVKMGLGRYGAAQAAKSGGILTIVLVTAYRVIDYFLTDSSTLNRLIGTLATDVVKIGITTGASIAAATGMAATGFLVAIGPLAAAIVVGVAVAWLLGELDQKYNVTEKVIAALDELSDGIENTIQNKKNEIIDAAERTILSIADSVIDYAVDRIQKILVNTARHALDNLPVPKI